MPTTGLLCSNTSSTLQADSKGAFVAQTVELPLTVYAYGDHDMVLQLHVAGVACTNTTHHNIHNRTQTSRIPPSVFLPGASLTFPPLTPGKGSVCVYDCDGRLCPIGINSAGLAVTVFNLHQGLGSVATSKSVLPFIPICRFHLCPSIQSTPP